MSKSLISRFQTPDAEFRGKPFWAWNGQLNKEDVVRQLSVMKDMGMGGYFCHSRTGLVTEYLGEEWFDFINACADAGEALGLETWLYDEDRWPSGTAGGMVTANPEYRIRYIRLNIAKAAEFEWSSDILSAFTVTLNGLSFFNKKRIFGKPEDETATILYFNLEEMQKSSFYNGYTYVDTMNPEATQAFITSTHELYRQKCGDRIGKSIKGIFTDEPHRGALLCGFGVPNKDAQNLAPYTASLFEDFENAFGYSLVDHLPELFLWPDGEKIHKTKWNYVELLQRLFLEHYLKPIHNWCEQNNMLLTGHVLHEDNLTAQTCMTGSVMRDYEQFDIPGIDVLFENNRNYWIVKQLASAARQLGKQYLLSELYGCTGWQMNFENYKAVGDWQALLGINIRCHHLAWYTMKGEAKRDYPASIFHQSAWYREYKYLEDYFTRIHIMMSQGKPVCDVLVINPVESAWSLVYTNWSDHLEINDPDVQKIEDTYQFIFKALMESKIDFDYGDEEMTGRLGSVGTDAHGAYIRVGKCTYRSVLVSGCITIRKSTVSLLKQFAEIGGNVVFAGDPPRYVDAVKSGEARLEPANYIPLEKAEIVRQLKAPDLATVSDENGMVNDIYVQIRKHGNEYILFLLNTNRDRDYNNVHLTLQEGGFLERWDPRTGTATLCGFYEEKAQTTLDLSRSGEALFVLTPDNHKLPAMAHLITKKTLPLPERFAYKLLEPNICVLDMAKYQINQTGWQKKDEILNVDRAIRRAFGMDFRGGDMLQPWFVKKKELKTVCKVDLSFAFFIESIPMRISLAMESADSFSLAVNGTELKSNISPLHWIDECFEVVELDPTLLVKGENAVTIQCDFSDDTNLEAIYLLGDFSIKLNGTKKTICSLSEQLKKGDITQQGFPFYSGALSYRNLNAPAIAQNEKLFLRFDGFDAACVKVTCEDGEEIIAFPPLEADITRFAGKSIDLQYILTRRNTFGPLHLKNIYPGGYGPFSFTPEKDEYRDDGYGLIKQGMTGDAAFLIKTQER